MGTGTGKLVVGKFSEDVAFSTISFSSWRVGIVDGLLLLEVSDLRPSKREASCTVGAFFGTTSTRFSWGWVDTQDLTGDGSNFLDNKLTHLDSCKEFSLSDEEIYISRSFEGSLFPVVGGAGIRIDDPSLFVSFISTLVECCGVGIKKLEFVDIIGSPNEVRRPLEITLPPLE